MSYRKIFFILAIAVSVILSGCTQAPQSKISLNQPNETDENSSAPASYTIHITSSGFSPSTLTIGAGDTVTWINDDSTPHWPASNPHPIHNGYPTTGGCIGSTFDACHGLAQGESWSFTFTYKGTWGYHDHLNPALGGTITVQ